MHDFVDFYFGTDIHLIRWQDGYKNYYYYITVKLVYDVCPSVSRYLRLPLISLLYNGEISQSVSNSVYVFMHFFELNQISHNSVNLKNIASRFCMVVRWVLFTLTWHTKLDPTVHNWERPSLGRWDPHSDTGTLTWTSVQLFTNYPSYVQPDPTLCARSK